ncbi:MAG TPA: DUF4956 domain-containing protein [bacterium]|nr:DUF4956 domain-containing protein [bacterium]HPS30537.1 DUF4956 domain-containing protein [bacterium]
MLDLLTLQNSTQGNSIIGIIFTVVLAFVLSTSIGLTYIKTFRGLSYSRNFVQAMMLSSIVSAIVMNAIGDSLARGLGMIGALAIIRFRTNLKDSRDIIFIFATLASGIACGVGAYLVGIAGIAMFIGAAFLLYYSQTTRTSFYDGILRFTLANNESDTKVFAQIMNEHCKVYALITMKEVSQGTRFEYAYHIKIRDKSSNELLVRALKAKLPELQGLNLMLQETTVEL